MSEPVAQNPLSLMSPEPPPPPTGQASPIMLLHRCLRGRYLAALALGLALAIPFGYLGYRSTTPKYRSSGLIRVMPTLPVTLYSTEEQKVPPMFDSFVSTQAAILRTRRVLNRAVEDPRLRETGWPAGVAGVAMLERTLRVVNERNSELISVVVEHGDPRMAQAALNAVLSAFEIVQEEFSGTNSSAREQQLVTIENRLRRDLVAKQDEIYRQSLEHGAADLEPIYMNRLSDLARLESAIASLDDQIARMEAQQAGNVDPAQDGELPPDEILAMTDPTLGNLLHERARLDAQIRVMEADYGPRHPDMVDLRRSRDAIQEQIDGRKRTVMAARNMMGTGADQAGAHAGMSLEQLRRLRADTAARHKQVEESFNRLNRARLTIGRLKDEEADIKRQLDDAANKLRQLSIERQNIAQGRVIVAQYGELPTGPARDRRKELALAGAMGGGGLGVALVAAFGFMRFGYRYIDDVEQNPLSLPLLGTIPDLRSGDPEHDEMAALSVPHLRNMLEQGGPAGPRAVHAITSGASGDGKTSLVLALGMSFAVSGHRTLLLDADLVGRRLSRLLGLSKQAGLGDLVGKPTVNGEIHTTRVPNLWAIPAGASADFSPERLSAADFRQLLEQLRGRFDRIIIDTGPVLGSLEASLVCPMADRVVLIVSAGQSPRIVQASIRKLEQLGAACAGMVFNRARRGDFDRSVSAAPLSRSIRSVAPTPDDRDSDDAASESSLIRALGAGRPATDRGRTE